MIDPSTTARFTGQSAQIHLTSKNVLRSLAPGSVVRIFVQDVAAGGTVVLRIGARTFTATTPLPLRQGEWYLARVMKTAGKPVLRVESQVPRTLAAAEVARSAGLPQNDMAEAVVRAFLRSGLPLDASRLTRVYRRVASRATGSAEARELARFEAIAQRKGIELPNDWWDVPGFGSGGGYRERRERRRDDPRSSGERDRSGASRLPRAGDVRKAFGMAEQATHPLQLFNHVVGEGDHWIVIPIAIPGEVEASLRIRIPRGYALGTDRSLPPYSEAVLVATRGESRWVFGLRPEGDRVRVSAVSLPDATDERLSALGTLLENAGAVFGGPASSPESHDGFSQPGSADIMTTVDSNA